MWLFFFFPDPWPCKPCKKSLACINIKKKCLFCIGVESINLYLSIIYLKSLSFDFIVIFLSFVKVKKGEIVMKGEVRYFELKQLILLSYCQAITFYLLLKSEGQPVYDHPIIARLEEIKKLLDQVLLFSKYLNICDFKDLVSKIICLMSMVSVVT